jgi:ATP-dependent DNA helicase RecQ
VRNAPDAAEALRMLLAHASELPLVAHNGATFDGPLIEATCRRLGVPLPPTFRVLDTLPLARALLPTFPAHRVGVLAEHFGCQCACKRVWSEGCESSSGMHTPACNRT